MPGSRAHPCQLLLPAALRSGEQVGFPQRWNCDSSSNLVLGYHFIPEFPSGLPNDAGRPSPSTSPSLSSFPFLPPRFFSLCPSHTDSLQPSPPYTWAPLSLGSFRCWGNYDTERPGRLTQEEVTAQLRGPAELPKRRTWFTFPSRAWETDRLLPKD